MRIKVPGGSFVLLSRFITQRLDKYWPDPDRFDPERFIAANVRGRHRFAWFPFSAGPRVFIGKQFSMIEGQLILVQVLREFRVNVDNKTLGFRAEVRYTRTARSTCGWSEDKKIYIHDTGCSRRVSLPPPL